MEWLGIIIIAVDLLPERACNVERHTNCSILVMSSSTFRCMTVGQNLVGHPSSRMTRVKFNRFRSIFLCSICIDGSYKLVNSLPKSKHENVQFFTNIFARQYNLRVPSLPVWGLWDQPICIIITSMNFGSMTLLFFSSTVKSVSPSFICNWPLLGVETSNCGPMLRKNNLRYRWIRILCRVLQLCTVLKNYFV